MRPKSKILIIISIIFLCTIPAILYFSNVTTEKKDSMVFSSQQRPGVSENSNKITYGLYSTDGELIDNGSTLDPINGQINKVISLSHFINETREYSLIILSNFKQVPFKIKGEEYLNYTFKMKPNSTINLNTIVNVGQDTKELDYLLIKKPNYLVKDRDIKKASILQEVIAMRFSITNSIKTRFDSENPLKEYSNGPNDYIFISKSMDKLGVVYKAKPDQKLYLSVGNVNKDEKKEFALVAFLGWKQVPLIDNKKVNYISVDPGKRKIYSLDLPKSDKAKNYQVISIPSPYNVSQTNYSSQMVYGSIRTIIEP
ncbi:hypothetical protein [Alkalihalobacillus sp. TS-13]|uniref:hypothetical protein n=1 Tax=Alkalihalobacillus sp. TS-13 TaxID=2842455 RepID=UPI001C87BA22|nr:hypothetical protein [Alkalihalobacillus sp. TS-13]